MHFSAKEGTRKVNAIIHTSTHGDEAMRYQAKWLDMAQHYFCFLSIARIYILACVYIAVVAQGCIALYLVVGSGHSLMSAAYLFSFLSMFSYR